MVNSIISLSSIGLILVVKFLVWFPISRKLSISLLDLGSLRKSISSMNLVTDLVTDLVTKKFLTWLTTSLISVSRRML